MVLTKYEEQQLQDIRSWKEEEPSAVSKGVGAMTAPLAWAVRKAVPEEAILAALTASNSLAKTLARPADLLREAGVESLDDLRALPLERLDALADSVHSWAIGFAAAEGAAGGASGLVGLVFDIPASITLALRTIHKIGLCYGYTCSSEEDARFAYGILGASGANVMDDKIAALTMLRAEKTVAGRITPDALVKAAQALAKQLGIHLTKRKALAAIPLVGAGIGGSVNAWWMREVGWAARRAFQERWLQDSKKLLGA